MKIGIDINDTVRAYTSQFATYYKTNIDREFDIDDLDVWSNDLKNIFPFPSKKEYLEFLYNDYPYEIFGCAKNCHKNLGSRLTDWIKEIENLVEIPELCILSTGEYDKTIGSTYFYLSKLACKIGETHLLLKNDDIWDKCDVIITANPDILDLKPENKLSVKINTSYNIDVESDLNYESMMDLLNDDEFINKLEELFKNK